MRPGRLRVDAGTPRRSSLSLPCQEHGSQMALGGNGVPSSARPIWATLRPKAEVGSGSPACCRDPGMSGPRGPCPRHFSELKSASPRTLSRKAGFFIPFTDEETEAWNRERPAQGTSIYNGERRGEGEAGQGGPEERGLGTTQTLRPCAQTLMSILTSQGLPSAPGEHVEECRRITLRVGVCLQGPRWDLPGRWAAL